MRDGEGRLKPEVTGEPATSVSRPIPEWACEQWGQHEHDWLDCSVCLSGYWTWMGNI
jgi:hypothetical protein